MNDTPQLTAEQLKYLHDYQQRRQLPTLQAALDQAIKALQEQDLGEQYAEYARSGEFKEFEDWDVFDGLELGDYNE